MGDGCACDAALVVNAKPGTPTVEAFTYIGPTGLRYGEGIVSGHLNASPSPLEVETGRTAPLYWEHLYLGELAPSPEIDIIHFNRSLDAGACDAFSREFIRSLTQLSGTDGRAVSIKELESMGFPGINTIKQSTTLEELAAAQSVMATLAINHEARLACASGG